MRAMQAARFGADSRLVPVNVPKPDLASGRLLVRMTAAGVTPILRYTVDSGLAGGTPDLLHRSRASRSDQRGYSRLKLKE